MAQFKTKDKAGKTVKNNWTAKFYYTNFNGKRLQKKKQGFKTLKEAKEFESDFLSKHNPKTDMKFKVLVELYLEYCDARLKVTTVATKTHMIKTKLLPFFGDMSINSIDAATVQQWQNEIISQGFKQTYLKVIHNQLSAIFNYAIRFYGLSKNPARICGSMGKKKADSMDFYTLEEFDTFISYFDDKLRSKTIFSLLFYSGMREGEMLGLCLNDFNFKTNTVLIERSYARLKKNDIIGDTKTYTSLRILNLPQFIMDQIKEYSELLYDYQSHQRLFTVSKSHLYTEMKRASIATGLRKIRVHQLRHSHASLLINTLNCSPLIVKERLGHTDIKMTLETYSHLYPQKHGDVAIKLNALGKKE